MMLIESDSVCVWGVWGGMPAWLCLELFSYCTWKSNARPLPGNSGATTHISGDAIEIHERRESRHDLEVGKTFAITTTKAIPGASRKRKRLVVSTMEQ